MYLSAFITQTFLSLLLFQVQHATRAKEDSSLMRLRAQKRTPFLSDDHLTPEEISNTELTTLASGDIPIDKTGSGDEHRNQQPWLQQDPVGFLLTDCTTTGTTDHFDQSSLLPSAGFQRRQTKIPNACNSQWNTQQGQMKLQQGDQGQEGQRGQTIPDVKRPGEGQAGEDAKPGEDLPPARLGPYPTSLELSNLFHYGRKGNPNEICNELVVQGIPICAPLSIPPQVSPAKLVVPARFCKCVFCFFSIFGFAMRGRTGKKLFRNLFSFPTLSPPRYGRLVTTSSFFFFPGFLSLFFYKGKKKSETTGRGAKPRKLIIWELIYRGRSRSLRKAR